MKTTAFVRSRVASPVLVSLSLSAACLDAIGAPVEGWLNWRGPHQNGTSLETHLPDRWELGGVNDLWSVRLRGRGTPVVAGRRVYAWGHEGAGPDLQEVLGCVDADTGRRHWERRFSDYLSDIIYDRYSIGAPTIDAETGNVYLLTSPGDLFCIDPESGKTLWEQGLAETLGRRTYPNGRTGAPAIDGDLVIVNVISSNWGVEGPVRNRFYAFDKLTGEIVWSSTPGVGPPYLKDSSFSTPVFAHDAAGRRVFYAGIGSGAVVCVNARNGAPIWRFQMSVGGVNSSVVLDGDAVIAVHGKENLDSSKIGRMLAIDRTATPRPTAAGAPLLDSTAEVWRNDICMFTSSPVLVGASVYQMSHTGILHCVDRRTGEIRWKKKLGADQIHASPLWADGKLYVPMHDGKLHVLRVSEDRCETLASIQLEGECLGSPAVWNGKIYVHTTERLYAFGRKGDSPTPPEHPSKPPRVAASPIAGAPRTLQIVPAEVTLRPGQRASFRVRSLDANGYVISERIEGIEWQSFMPPSARVRSRLDGRFDAGVLVAGDTLSAGAWRATAADLAGTIRARVLPSSSFREDFESFSLDSTHTSDALDEMRFAYPPLAWIGARLRWEIRERDGSNVLAKTLDRLLLSRAITFVGHPSSKSYTLQADVMTDGNRRSRGEIGLINQRYIVQLKGNHQEIEINSNHERVKHSVPFQVRARVWYTLKTRVDVDDDGSGTVRGKAWQRGQPEPDAWTIEFEHGIAHTHGAPGIFGFSPQNRVGVYVDNLSMVANGSKDEPRSSSTENR